MNIVLSRDPQIHPKIPPASQGAQHSHTRLAKEQSQRSHPVYCQSTKPQEAGPYDVDVKTDTEIRTAGPAHGCNPFLIRGSRKFNEKRADFSTNDIGITS